MSKHRDKLRGPSQRQLRVGELVKQALTEVLIRDGVHSTVANLELVTVSEVRMSPDLRHGKAYVMPLAGENIDVVLEELSEKAHVIRQMMSKKLHLKFLPQIGFRRDDSYEEASRIHSLLLKPEVKRDLGDDHGGEEE